jgi:REP element-mobilizing transposase RayT
MHLQFHHHGKQFFFFTACLQGRPQVLSTLVEGEKRPLLTPLGEAVQAVLVGTHGRNPALTMSDYVIMPDHVHFLLIADYDRDPTFDPISFMHEWRGLAAQKVGEVPSPAPIPPRGCGGSAPDRLVWERGYWISLAWYAEHRKAIRAYIRGNPARALWKRAHPDRFALHQRLRHASLDPALPWSGVGDLTLIASPFRFAVRLTRHREVAEQEAAIAEAVERAQRGMIPVCGFISPAERELQRRLRAEPTARWIKTVPHGLRPGYDPSLEDSRAIANGQLLILSSFPPDVPGDSITRANCELMNSRILALCGAAAEPIQTVGEGCLPGPLPNGREGAPSLNPAPFRGHGGSAPGLLGPFRRKP